MPTYDVPGVYIEEQTNPGVIAGVGTSTAAFIGPALAGPINEARRISSFDEFLELYGVTTPDGPFPYIINPTPFYMAHAVRGFYENGGSQAYIVRVGTGRRASLPVNNRGGEAAFIIEAQNDGTDGNNIQIETEETTGTARATSVGSATVVSGGGTDTITVDDASVFRQGDVVTEDETEFATITQIQGNVVTLSAPLVNLADTETVRIANLGPTQTSLRVTDTTGLIPGTVVQIDGVDISTGNPAANPDMGVIQSVDSVTRVVTLRVAPARRNVTYDMDVAQADAPTLTPLEFRLTITPPAPSMIPASQFNNLSLEPSHPNYLFNQTILDQIKRDSRAVQILKPATPPTAATLPDRLAVVVGPTPLLNGVQDQPTAVTDAEYQDGLDILRDVDAVNLVCIPDAAANPAWEVIQQAMREHCLALKDRFAIFDSIPGALPAGVEQQKLSIETERGYGALYYPWLEVVEPTEPGAVRPLLPRRMFIPPSGHIAGVYARTDEERGVHKAPANVVVRGVLGLERVLSDGQHGPLNDPGNINVLRIFPGTAQVVVWGARTAANINDTDWRYVNVRRLMLFLEESIEESLKFSAVFEPNNLALWEKLKRILNEFLTRVWRDGALFGAKPEQAFRVRIDEALNPPSTRALGRLYIEISVAAVRPAEFIIVRIGLSRDGASDVSEG